MEAATACMMLVQDKICSRRKDRKVGEDRAAVRNALLSIFFPLATGLGESEPEPALGAVTGTFWAAGVKNDPASAGERGLPSVGRRTAWKTRIMAFSASY